MYVFNVLFYLAIISPAAMALSSVAYMYLWNWFVVPFGAVSVGFWMSFGAVVFLSALTIPYRKADDEIKEKIKTIDFIPEIFGRIAGVQVWLWVLVLIGFILKTYGG